MHLRLASATSTAVDPEVLLLDEMLAAGDGSFTESARDRMNGLMERANIVVFATPTLDVMPRFCELTILPSQGRIVALEPTEEVVRVYTDDASEAPGARAEYARSARSRSVR